MRRHERGITFFGWLFLLTPLALVGYAGIRLTPVYLEYMKVARTLDQVSKDFKGDQVDSFALRSSIERHFDIEDVTIIKKDDIKVEKDNDKYTLTADYTDAAPFISNVSLQVKFHKVVTLE